MPPRTGDWDVRTGIGTTAVVTAAGRAIETHRADRLVADPYAEALVTAARPARPVPTRPAADPADDLWRQMSDLMGLRTRFFDDVLRQATDDGLRQVVLLGSGLDTRTHRLGWPSGTRVFEIDQPAVLDFKQGVLDAPAACDHRPVPHDLRGEWPAALRAAGFDPGEPTVWIAEGLLFYLPPGAARRLLESVDDASAPGSRWALEDDNDFGQRLHDPAVRASYTAAGLDLGALIGDEPRPEPGPWLRARRWVVEEQTMRTAAVEYRRALHPVTDLAAGSFILTCSRKR